MVISCRRLDKVLEEMLKGHIKIIRISLELSQNITNKYSITEFNGVGLAATEREKVSQAEPSCSLN